MLANLMSSARRRKRWSDHDHYFGPFTYANDNPSKVAHLSRRWTWEILLDSGEDEYPGCGLRLRAFGRTLIVALPQIIQPWREKHIAQSWDAATVARMGRNWYYEEHRREYGVSYSDGFLRVFYGAQTDDSSTEKLWCKHLPWTQWRPWREALFDTNGQIVWQQFDDAVPPRERFDRFYAAKAICPTMHFYFADYDGQMIVATTHLHERAYRFGQGWFKWLSLFRRPMVRRSLEIQFSHGVGREKGSWKGGTMGHGIEVVPGELHMSAFKRYCTAYKLTFGGVSADSAADYKRHG